MHKFSTLNQVNYIINCYAYKQKLEKRIAN